MLDKEYLNCIERLLRKIVLDNEDEIPTAETLFGGRPILFVGDFKQIPPLGQGTVADSVSSSIKTLAWWNEVKELTLTQQHRIRHGPYADFLTRIGNGIDMTGKKIDGTFVVELPDYLKDVSTPQQAWEFICGNDADNPVEMGKHFICCFRNEDVETDRN